jgi:hypothetical protein
MNPIDVIEGRTEVSRRLVILDGDYRIISSQQPLPCEDRFSFSADAMRLPLELEQAVKAATSSWDYMRRSETRVVLDDAICMRVFQLQGSGVPRIAVILEWYRFRASDA